LKYSDTLHKVTIIPRGRAGGVTFFLPEDDREEVSREWCLDTITLSLGGRVAEQLVLNRMGSGARADIDGLSKLVRKMITQWGMSDKLGPISFGEREEQIFLGREIHQRQDYSEQTAQAIDAEVSRIVTECYDRAKKILEENMDALHAVAKALLERETLDREEMDLILAGKELPPLKRKNETTGKPDRADAKKEPSAETRPEFPGKPQPFPRPDTP
ncbi:MAG: cell division protein FtsH, partial [bacterium]